MSSGLVDRPRERRFGRPVFCLRVRTLAGTLRPRSARMRSVPAARRQEPEANHRHSLRARTRHRRSHAAAQPRGREIGARRGADPQRGVQLRRGADFVARLLPRRPPAHLRQDGAALRAWRCHRPGDAQGGARARRGPRRDRRRRVPGVARRRRAPVDQRRALRAHRQGEVRPPRADPGDAADQRPGVPRPRTTRTRSSTKRSRRSSPLPRTAPGSGSCRCATSCRSRCRRSSSCSSRRS